MSRRYFEEHDDDNMKDLLVKQCSNDSVSSRVCVMK